MHLTVELLRTADGRLEGIVTTESGREQRFSGTLDLLRILEELEPPAEPSLGRAAAAAAVTAPTAPDAPDERGARGSRRSAGSSSRCCSSSRWCCCTGPRSSPIRTRRTRRSTRTAATSSSSPSGSTSCPFAGIAFLWHMTAMRNVLDTLTPAPSTMAHGLNLLAGVIFVTLLFAGTAAVGAVAFGIYFGHTPAEDPAVARALTGVGYGLVFVFAVRGAGMFALTTTTLLRTAKVLPHDPGRARLPARRFPAARRDQQPRRRPRLPGVGRADLGVPAAPRRATRSLPTALRRHPPEPRSES